MEEMSDGRRAFIAIAISLLILLVWSHYYKPPVPPPAPPAAVGQNAASANTSNSSQGPVPLAPSTAMAMSAPVQLGALQAQTEQTTVVESPLYRVVLSNRGGVVKSWELKKYSDDQTPPHPLNLVNDQIAQQLGDWPFSVALVDPAMEAKVNSALAVVSLGGATACPVAGQTPDSNVKSPGSTKSASKLKPAASPASATSAASTKGASSQNAVVPATLTAPADICFVWSDGNLGFTKRLKFDATYVVDVELSVTLNGSPVPAAIAWRGGFGDRNVYQAAQLVTVYYRSGGKLTQMPYKKLGVSGHQDQRVLQVGPLEYAGIEDQFFTAAFLPDGPSLDLWQWARFHDVTVDDKPTQEPVASMAAGSAVPGPVDVRVFVGPKDFDLLSKQHPPMEDLINFGYISILAKPLLYTLQWIHRYVSNYGWCIVLLTLALNMVLFPLKMSSWRSMQKMQVVAPEIKQIQDRYKKYKMNDPRKQDMNKEVMAVYNREGINPMGSCIPMLMQFPIWAALYRMLGGTIELRHAPWMGWIHDLSARDPYYILPILMTLTMYLMQKMTPTATVDPAQQKMMTLMPLMMGFLFFRFSAGLILYIFTSNLVGMAQQYYLNRNKPVPVSAKGKSKNKNSG
jgi:YidC/Oxa1 family membrane protein insertase